MGQFFTDLDLGYVGIVGQMLKIMFGHHVLLPFFEVKVKGRGQTSGVQQIILPMHWPGLIAIIHMIYRKLQWSRKLFLVCWTKCPAGLQCSAGHFELLSDIFPSWCRWWMANISGHSTHIMCIQPCWTKCPARSKLSAGHQQKSAGHVWHALHISRSLKLVVSQFSKKSPTLVVRRPKRFMDPIFFDDIHRLLVLH